MSEMIIETKTQRAKRVFICKDKEPDKEYFEALKKAGVEFEWGEYPQDVNDFDGLLIPGGVDVNPMLYGHENTASVKINDHLDKITMDCIRLFFENGKAILGICRGLQILNVFFGGTLVQDIPNHKDVEHKILIDSGNILHDSYGDEMQVNSIHHQCINTLGNGLESLAKSEDGIIEAIMHNGKKVFATQFHPEKMQNGENIFKIFKNMLEN